MQKNKKSREKPYLSIRVWLFLLFLRITQKISNLRTYKISGFTRDIFWLNIISIQNILRFKTLENGEGKKNWLM